jgi:hypothetical protein
MARGLLTANLPHRSEEVEKILSGKALSGMRTTEKVRSLERTSENKKDVYLRYLRPQESGYDTMLNILLNIL